MSMLQKTELVKTNIGELLLRDARDGSRQNPQGKSGTMAKDSLMCIAQLSLPKMLTQK